MPDKVVMYRFTCPSCNCTADGPKPFIEQYALEHRDLAMHTGTIHPKP